MYLKPYPLGLRNPYMNPRISYLLCFMIFYEGLPLKSSQVLLIQTQMTPQTIYKSALTKLMVHRI